MNRLVVNVVALVVSPALVATGFLTGIRRLLGGRLDGRAVPGDWTALVVVALGGYLLGHPFYPEVVPLVRASTPWLFAVGGAYLILGAMSLVAARARRFSAVGAYATALLAIAVAVLAAHGPDPDAIVRLVVGSDVGPPLYTSVPAALLFALGYADCDDGHGFSHPVALVFVSYALLFANSIPLTERVRGPVGLFFVVFGSIGVLVGIPTYLLGRSLGSAVAEEP
ncbi:hypothetical protein [Halorussus salinus]|uniref:hypothetical protein n=1 Tax=Halorussus salinus TaxID=1364935 RepID=UPI0010923BE9|nr:hypothetical protein [Halorussus salinus]